MPSDVLMPWDNPGPWQNFSIKDEDDQEASSLLVRGKTPDITRKYDPLQTVGESPEPSPSRQPCLGQVLPGTAAACGEGWGGG